MINGNGLIIMVILMITNNRFIII